ncbi:hypothetical protein DICSQDRAFT_174532 [Dichomitus squalens LYAD-421 SS1]|uniref:Uncharacterized protein n=1 Tax=Dichomitus squalens (strain LYAD-421) TaxID=732165 RepID=R7SM89_DICSQ|nr:uncharacterized protein DICSQDRAFT_174532 [Dichomitus squalens LYAD-421 SS1]EJF56850.1 hypothetical protein DICSQDRAFT_174532 [Dichomitus squalens LYAD-421 SS1]
MIIVQELALLELSFFACWTTSFTVLPNGDHQLLSSAIRSPLLRAARCALSSFRPPSGVSYAVIRSLLPSQPGPPLGRIMLTPSLLLGPARPPSMDPLAITPPLGPGAGAGPRLGAITSLWADPHAQPPEPPALRFTLLPGLSSAHRSRERAHSEQRHAGSGRREIDKIVSY